MAITYDWTISSLECHTKVDKKEKVVFNVHWRYGARDAEYFAETYGCESLNTDNLKNFVKYEDLTKETIVSWLEEAMGQEKITTMQQGLAAGIETQKNPPVVSPPLPWSNINTPEQPPVVSE